MWPSTITKTLIFAAIIWFSQTATAKALQTTQRFAAPAGLRCSNIFVKTLAERQLLEEWAKDPFGLRNQKNSSDGQWWFAAKEIQNYLNETQSLAELMQRLKSLGAISKDLRRGKRHEDFDTFDVHYNIFISVDYIKPLSRFRDELTTTQKKEILSSLANILFLPLWQRNRTSFSDFYLKDFHWDPRYSNLLMFEAFLNPNRMDSFLKYFIEFDGGLGAESMTRGGDRSGWGDINPSFISFLGLLDAKASAQLVVKLRETIQTNRVLSKDDSLDSTTRDQATTLRRNGEVLLNLLFYRETMKLIEDLKNPKLTQAEVFEKVEQFLEQKNGYKPDLDFATLRLIAKEVADTFLELGLTGDTLIVGSAVSGRFKKRDSDFDLIPNLEVQTFFEEGFKIGPHRMIHFEKPLSEPYQEPSKVLLEMQRRVHQILKNRGNKNIFGSSGISINTPSLTRQQQADFSLFGFSSMNNNLSIRITDGKVFLGIYDPVNYTNYELDITN